jgi:hypothetical protein
VVNVYIVCREGHPLYEKYLQNLSGDQVKVVGVYSAPARMRNDCSQYVLGSALATAELLGADVILCESSLCNTTNINVSHEMEMRVVDLEVLFSLQVNAFVNKRSIADGFRWLARNIVGMRETREIIIFSPELFDAPLGGLDGDLEHQSKKSRINSAWLCYQLDQVFPTVRKEFVSEPDFLQGRFLELPETTLLVASGRIWSRARNSTSAMFFPLPFSCSAVELILANPLAFDFSLVQLCADIVSFNEYPSRK